MPSHRQATTGRKPTSGRHRHPDAVAQQPSVAAAGRHRGAPPPKSRYAAVATTAILGAGIVALATAASLPGSNTGTLPAAASVSVDSPVAGLGRSDGVPAVHGTAARYDPRVGIVAPRAARSRPKTVTGSLLPRGVGRLTSCFCPRWGSFHNGLDIAAPMLTPIYAASAGVVTEAGPKSGFGNWVVIAHDSTTDTLYGHMEKVLVREGQKVRAGQLIALVGNRGFSTGPHLHFEVHLNGTPVNPTPWLERRGIRY